MKIQGKIPSAKLIGLTFSVLLGLFSVLLGNPFNHTTSSSPDSTANGFEIDGPERVCLVGGNRIEEFSGGGNPDTDIYRWTVTDPSGAVRIFEGDGVFETLTFTFAQQGVYSITLLVSRAGVPLGGLQTKEILVTAGAQIELQKNYALCPGEGILLRALSPATAGLSDYTIIWKNDAGAIVSESNEFFVEEAGEFTVEFFVENSEGARECENTISTNVRVSAEFELQLNQSNFCPGNEIIATTDPSVQGRWYIEKQGEEKVFFGTNISLNLATAELPGFGEYTLIFELVNENNPDCSPTETKTFTYGPFPAFVVEEEVSSSQCFVGDGVLKITALSDITLISLVLDDEETQVLASNLSVGQEFLLENLESGVYTFEAFLNGCRFTYAAVVNLEDVPDQLKFSIDPDSIVPETCSDEGVNPGSFTVVFEGGPVDVLYELYFVNGGLAGQGELKSAPEGQTEFTIETQGGAYYFEIFLPKDEDDDVDEDEEDDNRCLVPFVEEFEVPGIPQVEFNVPRQFNFCEIYELIPETNQPLEFTLRHVSTGEEWIGDQFTLEKDGVYEIIGRHLTQPDAICPRKVTINTQKVDPVEFEVDLVSLVCSTGSQLWEVELLNYDESEVSIRWFDEVGVQVSDITTMAPATFGMYTIEIQPINILGSCPLDPYEFEVPDLLNLEIETEVTQLCPFGPDATIKVDAVRDFVGRIRWRYFDQDGEVSVLTSFENQEEITVSESGIYEVTLFNSINPSCPMGRIETPVTLSDNLTQFEVPEEELVVCERYEWIPESNFPLNYILTYPDGTEITATSSETFTLDQTGEYLIRGEDPQNPVCPNEKSFQVRVIDAVVFSPELVNQTCDGEFTYAANFAPAQLNDVVIFWSDQSGNLLGSEPTFSTSTPGIYTLEVQPAGSLPCDVLPFEFEIVQPILSVNVQLTAGVICPDEESAIIELGIDNMEVVDRIEWVFTGIDGNTETLGSFTNLLEIIAEREGWYEARVFNRLDCLLGDQSVFISKSIDDVRPEVKEVYQICAEYEIGETINPGNFSTYSWFLEEELVSTSSTYKPQLVGTYTLVVNSQENCEYMTTFEVEEECELRIAHPNAIIPGDPERNFIVFSNYLVDELDIWIFNKWGQEVFNCSERNILENTEMCIWDGFYNGEKIPIGAYAVRIRYKNIQEGIEETKLTSLTVIE